MEELKPCPCCDRNTTGIEKEVSDSAASGFYVECFHCGTRTAARLREKNAIKAWNTRPTPSNIKDIQWSGECPCPPNDYDNTGEVCEICNGTGQITRKATVEEMLGMLPKVLKAMKQTNISSPAYREYLLKEALTINNGTLRVKGE